MVASANTEYDPLPYMKDVSQSIYREICCVQAMTGMSRNEAELVVSMASIAPAVAHAAAAIGKAQPSLGETREIVNKIIELVNNECRD
ncbi:MAG: hypothetical protein AAGJ40_09185 [Planctomycetota bacterium]